MNETESTLNIRLEVVVTDENINDIMACALEGGINYWADDAQVIEEYHGNNEYEHFLNNGKLAIHLIEGPIEKHGPEWCELDKKRFINGLRKYLQDPLAPYYILCYNDAYHRLEIDTGKADAVVCDMIFQYALFDEIVFS